MTDSREKPEQNMTEHSTRSLEAIFDTAEKMPMPVRATGPLDEVLPWVIELRVVGTASTLQVRVSEHMTIGRSDPERGIKPDIDLAPYGGHVLGVSRQHAVISAKDDRISIRDIGSSNGTRLNGYGLKTGQEYRLRHGDELTVGQLHLQVLFAVVPLVGENKSDDKTESKQPDSLIPKVGSGQQVLVVEDDADVASVYAMILEHAGFRVAVTSTAMAAMSYIGQKPPDAVVLDLMLPDIDGLELVHYIRNKDVMDGRHTPVVIVSGITGGFQMNQALKAGADLFLGKPVGVDELVRAFASLVVQMA